ncbi:Na(+)-translocating NADH-quinone reductase subunit F [Flavobacteriaceae bacterium LMO-SS05]
MKTSQRLDQALNKLYNAFHNGTLHPEYCNSCAVGTILDQTDSWKHLTDIHGSTQLNYVGLVNQNFGRRFNGYTPSELLQIESVFLKGCGYSGPLDRQCQKPKHPTHKDVLFNGLSAVVPFLCKLDNIHNVMDYSSLFKFETRRSKYPQEAVSN